MFFITPQETKIGLNSKLKQTRTHAKLVNPSFEKKSNEFVTLATLSMALSHKLEQPIKSASCVGSATSKSVPHSIHPSSGNAKSSLNFAHNFDAASYWETVKSMHSSCVVLGALTPDCSFKEERGLGWVKGKY